MCRDCHDAQTNYDKQLSLVTVVTKEVHTIWMEEQH